MTHGVVRPSMQALALAASLALVMPTAASAFSASSPMTVAAMANGSPLVTSVAWHGRVWRGRGYGWGPGALFAGATLGVLGLAIANSYDYAYACDPYGPYGYYGSCGPYYGGPVYAYGYPYGGYYGYGPRWGGGGPRFAHVGGRMRWRR